ncbi:MAG: glycosyltransferase family 39 protein [Candidatus Peribacteraceae bacterium]|nr:glycosyltransferase family 39 protein [Candidatus Peribacteraceae bacterium]
MKQKTVHILSITFFVCLVLWGIYTLLYYLGVPVHGVVLLASESNARLNELCDSNAYLCRGLFGFFPFISHTFERMRPLLSYGVISLFLYGGYLLYSGFNTGRFSIPFNLKPWHIFTFFIVSLFLIFSSIAFGSVETNTTSGVTKMPFRQIIEPTSLVYRSVAAEALAELQQNFNHLNDMGCLKENGFFAHDASKYLVSSKCIYSAFISRTLSQVLFISLLILELLVLGRMLLLFIPKICNLICRRLPKYSPENWSLNIESSITEAVLCSAFGASLFIAILWFFAVAGVLTSPVGWGFVILVPIIGYKQVIYFLKKFISSSVHIELRAVNINLFLFWLLISYLALNFLNVIRPFPIGWDDLGSYLNRPRLMVSYGEFIFSMAPFQWEYLTSLGYLLFGYNSFFGATSSMLINWMAGLLAISSIFIFVRYFLGKGNGLLSAILYYFLPLVGHFSFADMKIDNSVFAMGSISIFALFRFLFPHLPEGEKWSPKWIWLVISGLIGGVAFGIKPTAIMVLMANWAVLLAVLMHGIAFIGVIFAAVILLIKKGVLNVDNLTERLSISSSILSFEVVFAFMVFVTLIIIGFALFYSRKRFSIVFKAILILFISTAIPIIPWVIHNNAVRGWESIGLEFGAVNNITPMFDLSGSGGGELGNNRKIISLAPDIAVDMNNSICQPTGHKEELDRYWGFEKGWSHYLTLPWRSVNNLDSGGYYVTTMPGFLLFPLLLLLPFFWMEKALWLRWLFAGTLFILVQWIFLGNGIPWYGIGVFFGLSIGLEVLFYKAPDFPAKLVLGFLLALWILIMLNNRFWQYEMQKNIFEYSVGKVDAETMVERTIPHYNDIADMVIHRNESIPTRPYLYRIGTFIPYFIPRNLEIIGIVDHQLDTFNCMYQERDPALTIKRLKALGFNSIIFDTNTSTIERDPNGSLHKKVQTFMNFLTNSESGIEVVINDSTAGVAFFLIP